MIARTIKYYQYIIVYPCSINVRRLRLDTVSPTTCPFGMLVSEEDPSLGGAEALR